MRDDFYTKLMGELPDVNQRQAEFYKAHHKEMDSTKIMSSSLADFISKKITSEKLSEKKEKEECKQMR